MFVWLFEVNFFYDGYSDLGFSIVVSYLAVGWLV